MTKKILSPLIAHSYDKKTSKNLKINFEAFNFASFIDIAIDF
jgi:hypothetical protein